MGSFSDYLEGLILDEWFGGVPAAVPDTYYIALGTGDADDSTFTELDAGGYVRFPLANTKDNWTTAGSAGGSVATKVEVPYGPATTRWGDVTSYAVYDIDDNQYGAGEFDEPHRVLSGESGRFPAGTIVVSLD